VLQTTFATSELLTAALLLLYCCFTAALLPLYCCVTAALMALYWCFLLQVLHHIHIFNRGDCCADRLRGFRLLLSNSSGTTF
jgi:hypothetical protein